MNQLTQLPYFNAEEIFERVSMNDAVRSLEEALREGLEPASSLSRTSVRLRHGSYLLMPAEYGHLAGVKVATVSPENPARGLPKIQGTFLLFDAATLTPRAIMDGAALTAIRTPALSALGVDYLASSGATKLLVFGTGPQAFNHVLATAAVRPVVNVEVVGRSVSKAQQFVHRLTDAGFNANLGSTEGVARADIVLCCTSAREPLFDGSLVRDDAVVVAMGSHEPDAREVDDTLVGRSIVYVEDIDTALREAGDVALAIRHGALSEEDLRELASLVRDGAEIRQGPAFFKTVGMGWQDLVTAQLVLRGREH